MALFFSGSKLGANVIAIDPLTPSFSLDRDTSLRQRFASRSDYHLRASSVHYAEGIASSVQGA